MKKTNKLLLLSMMMLLYTSCSKTETGVIALKKDSTVFVRLTDDTTVFRVLDFTLVNNSRYLHGGKIDGRNMYQTFDEDDTLTYKNIDNHIFIMFRNWGQIQKINNIKMQEFLRNHTNTK